MSFILNGKMASFAAFLIFSLTTITVSSQELSAIISNPVAHESFNSSLYTLAQNITSERWKRLNGAQIDEFTQFTTDVEKALHQKMKDITGQNDKTMDELVQIMQNLFSQGQITSAEISTIRSLSRALQQAYTKKVIKLFNLAPEELEVSKDYVCDVFAICQTEVSERSVDDGDENLTSIESTQDPDVSNKIEMKPNEVTPTVAQEEEVVNNESVSEDRSDSKVTEYEDLEEPAETIEASTEVTETTAQPSTPAKDEISSEITTTPPQQTTSAKDDMAQEQLEASDEEKLEETNPVENLESENLAEEAVEQTKEDEQTKEEETEDIEESENNQDTKVQEEEVVPENNESGKNPPENMDNTEEFPDVSGRRSDSNQNMETTSPPPTDSRSGLSQGNVESEISSTEKTVVVTTKEEVKLEDPETAESVNAEAESSANFVQFQLALLPVVILTFLLTC